MGAGTGVETLNGSGATIEQAGRAMKHLEALLRAGTDSAIAGPAEVYYALGVCQQIVAAWQHSARHLEAWLDDQYDRGHLAVTDGPFADDPAAAVATTVAALQDARRARLDLQAGLERAESVKSNETWSLLLMNRGLGPWDRPSTQNKIGRHLLQATSTHTAS